MWTTPYPQGYGVVMTRSLHGAILDVEGGNSVGPTAAHAVVAGPPAA